MVVISPLTIPNVSRSTLAVVDRQLVVQEAFEMMWCFFGSYWSWLIPKLTVTSGCLAGAEMITFLAPAEKCFSAEARSVNRPLHSSTTSTFSAFQGRAAGSLSAVTSISFPSITSPFSVAVTFPGKVRCTESYLNKCASADGLSMSLTATTSSCSPRANAARMMQRPIRPNPLIANLTAIEISFIWAAESRRQRLRSQRRSRLLLRHRPPAKSVIAVRGSAKIRIRRAMVQMTARRIDPPPPYPSRQGTGLFQSFVHAWRGLIHAVVHQRNMRIHILAGILVGLAEKVTLVFCVLLIFFAEILNSALEQLVDLAVEQVHEKARLAKDAAAAGVLVLAIGTVVIFVAIVVHNWHTVVSHTEQIERQVALGVPFTVCAGILMMPNPRGLWADVALFGIGCALLFALARRSESLVFTAMTFGLLIVAGDASRSRRRTRTRALRLKRDAPAETGLPPRKEPSFPTRAGQP